jgi:hypothetical protein
MPMTINLSDLGITITSTTSTSACECDEPESGPAISSTYEMSENNDQQAIAPPLVLNQD